MTSIMMGVLVASVPQTGEANDNHDVVYVQPTANGRSVAGTMHSTIIPLRQQQQWHITDKKPYRYSATHTSGSQDPANKISSFDCRLDNSGRTRPRFQYTTDIDGMAKSRKGSFTLHDNHNEKTKQNSGKRRGLGMKPPVDGDGIFRVLEQSATQRKKPSKKRIKKSTEQPPPPPLTLGHLRRTKL